jgi:hypothetical protein
MLRLSFVLFRYSWSLLMFDNWELKVLFCLLVSITILAKRRQAKSGSSSSARTSNRFLVLVPLTAAVI